MFQVLYAADKPQQFVKTYGAAQAEFDRLLKRQPIPLREVVNAAMCARRTESATDQFVCARKKLAAIIHSEL